MLREVLDRLARNYKHVVLDSEAGLEHVSRRTLLSLDYLMIVSDCTVRGIHTAGRISALADEVALPAKRRGLIVNRVPGGELPAAVRAAVEDTHLPLLATVPLDPCIAAFDADGLSIQSIPLDSPARLAIDAVLEQIFIAQLEAR